MKLRKNQKGFTLIEVVLVLAIGGLIFLLAFLAFQQVSTNRRDTQRRSDANRALAELANAQGDGMTVTSANLATFTSQYLGSPFEAPRGGNYSVCFGAPAASPCNLAENRMFIGVGQVCSGNSGFTASAGNNAVIVGQEKSSSCRDDQ